MITKWLKRLAVVFAAALILTGGAATAPAHAAFGGVCNGNAFCAYQWTGLGAQVANDRWQSSYTNIINNHGGCINLAGATWDNGTAVNDNTGSLMWNTVDSGYDQYAITVFNWANCNTSGQWKVIGYLGGALSMYSLDNLNNYTYQSPPGTTMKLYHTITSIGIRCVIC